MGQEIEVFFGDLYSVEMKKNGFAGARKWGIYS